MKRAWMVKCVCCTNVRTRAHISRVHVTVGDIKSHLSHGKMVERRESQRPEPLLYVAEEI